MTGKVLTMLMLTGVLGWKWSSARSVDIRRSSGSERAHQVWEAGAGEERPKVATTAIFGSSHSDLKHR